MIIDFRKFKALPDPIIINDHTVEHVRTYKYLGVMLNLHGQAIIIIMVIFKCYFSGELIALS